MWEEEGRRRNHRRKDSLEPGLEGIFALVVVDGLDQPPSSVDEGSLECGLGVRSEGVVEELDVAAPLQRPDVLLEEFPLVARLLLGRH